MSAIDTRQLRDACGHFGTGVTIITTRYDGHDHGMTANAFMSISLDPPLVAISIRDTRQDACHGPAVPAVCRQHSSGRAWRISPGTLPESQRRTSAIFSTDTIGCPPSLTLQRTS